MNEVLANWNNLSTDAAANEILACCGSKAWALGVAARKPFAAETDLLAASDEIWRNLTELDWLEAFRSHPRIGESRAPESAKTRSAVWSAQEQREVSSVEDAVKIALAGGNRAYEKRFGRVFIVCATGKSAPEILEILKQRLQYDDKTELREAAEQQRQITQLRLRKWLKG